MWTGATGLPGHHWYGAAARRKNEKNENRSDGRSHPANGHSRHGWRNQRYEWRRAARSARHPDPAIRKVDRPPWQDDLRGDLGAAAEVGRGRNSRHGSIADAGYRRSGKGRYIESGWQRAVRHGPDRRHREGWRAASRYFDAR